MKFSIILLFLFSCSPSEDLKISAQSITEFDSTGGRFSELIVAKNVTPDYDVDDFVRIGTAKDALRWSIETIYQTNKAPLINGFRDKNSLHFLLCKMTKQFQMMRISNDEVERTRFFTSDSTGVTRLVFIDTLTNTANEKNERIDVSVFLARRLKSSRHNIFGEVGKEVWFGGRTDNSFSVLSAFWDSVLVEVPSSMSKRDAMTREYPVHFLKKYRVFRMMDIPDTTANRLVLPNTSSRKRQRKLFLTPADSILVQGKSDVRNVKTFSFNSNSKRKEAK